jgi:16S rRNA (guanine527-N7)-methyltransferase
VLGLKNIKVLKTTINPKNTLEKYSTITARAFSSTGNILALTKNNLTKNGRYLLLKGRVEKIEEEIAAINTNNYKCEIIKVENKKYERHLVQITKNE